MAEAEVGMDMVGIGMAGMGVTGTGVAAGVTMAVADVVLILSLWAVRAMSSSDGWRLSSASLWSGLEAIANSKVDTVGENFFTGENPWAVATQITTGAVEKSSNDEKERVFKLDAFSCLMGSIH